MMSDDVYAFDLGDEEEEERAVAQPAPRAVALLRKHVVPPKSLAAPLPTTEGNVASSRLVGFDDFKQRSRNEKSTPAALLLQPRRTPAFIAPLKQAPLPTSPPRSNAVSITQLATAATVDSTVQRIPVLASVSVSIGSPLPPDDTRRESELLEEVEEELVHPEEVVAPPAQPSATSHLSGYSDDEFEELDAALPVANAQPALSTNSESSFAHPVVGELPRHGNAELSHALPSDSRMLERPLYYAHDLRHFAAAGGSSAPPVSGNAFAHPPVTAAAAAAATGQPEGFGSFPQHDFTSTYKNSALLQHPLVVAAMKRYDSALRRSDEIHAAQLAMTRNRIARVL